MEEAQKPDPEADAFERIANTEVEFAVNLMTEVIRKLDIRQHLASPGREGLVRDLHTAAILGTSIHIAETTAVQPLRVQNLAQAVAANWQKKTAEADEHVAAIEKKASPLIITGKK